MAVGAHILIAEHPDFSGSRDQNLLMGQTPSPMARL